MLADWEGAAASLHEATGLGEPAVSALTLARGAGFWLEGGDECPELLDERVIRYDPEAEATRQHEQVATQLGRWVARSKRLPHEATDYVAGALLLPLQVFERDLQEDWSIPRLQAKHMHASAAMIARRIVHLRDAVATVLDGDRIEGREWSPWIHESRRWSRLSRWERELAKRALDCDSVAEGDSHCYALPVTEEGRPRVIVVCEMAQLAWRL